LIIQQKTTSSVVRSEITTTQDQPSCHGETDKTPALPPGIGQSPMPYPGYGFEFSDGLNGHLTLRLRIRGDDMWIKDDVNLYVRYIRERATSFDTLAWVEDPDWTYIASWTQDVPMSTDSSEGSATWNSRLT